VGYVIIVGLVEGYVIGLVVEDRREEGKDMCVYKTKEGSGLVIVRYVRLGKNQAEIRQKVVPPVNRGRANSLTHSQWALYYRKG
jgi:hypothetical protein